jgi:hypothetical protein
MTVKQGQKPFVSKFELRFRNGVISEYPSIENIFTEENIGSSAIRRLSLHYADQEKEPSVKIVLDFIDPTEGFDDPSII